MLKIILKLIKYPHRFLIKLKFFNEKGLKNIYVTSGYETHKAIDLLEPYIDGMNIDIKSFSNEFYKEICGAKLKPVLETVK